MPSENIVLIVTAIIVLPIVVWVYKEMREDYKEHKAIDEALGEHTPY